MNFHDAKFSAAFGTSAQLPPSSGPEVSFCGRSNVGKSSLLNCLMHRKGLAKVSAKPGKTATINFYDVDGADFVDLPGYGFAHVSKSEKSRWSELIDGYFNQTRAFALVVVLVDIRHMKVSQLDIDMVDFVRESELPFVIALTKADKLSRQGAQKNAAAIRRALGLKGVSETAMIKTREALETTATPKTNAVVETTATPKTSVATETVATAMTTKTSSTTETTTMSKTNPMSGANADGAKLPCGKPLDSPACSHCLGVIPISSQTGTNIDRLRSIIERAVDFPEP